MAIYTYADLKQKILDTDECRKLMEKYKMYKKGKGGFLNSIKGVLPTTVSWTSWFDDNPEIRKKCC